MCFAGSADECVILIIEDDGWTLGEKLPEQDFLTRTQRLAGFGLR